VVNVADRADVYVRFGTFKFALCHDISSLI